MRERYRDREAEHGASVYVWNTNIPFMESLCDARFSLSFRGVSLRHAPDHYNGAAHTQKPMSRALFVLWHPLLGQLPDAKGINKPGFLL